MSSKGFTLIELLITVAIIGILAAIGIPAYIGQQKNAARTEAFTNLQNLALLESQFFAERGRYVPCAAPAPYVSPVPPATVTLGTAGKDNPLNSFNSADGNMRGVIQRGLGVAVNGIDYENALPGFKPGNGTSFSYWIVNGQKITNANAQPITGGVANLSAGPPVDPPCFVVFAAGNTTSRVNGEIYAIDCNNTRNF